MTYYSYTGRKAGQGEVSGVLESNSLDEVVNTLMRMGITPVRIQETANGDAPAQFDLAGLFGFMQFKVATDELILFSRQMYSLTKAGVPIIRALRGIAGTTRQEEWGKIILQLADELESGYELSKAMRRHTHIFPPLMISLVDVGENTGQLDLAFAQIAAYLERDDETHKQITSALRYPSFVIIAIAAAMIIINMFVIPAFAKMFAKFGTALPWQTRVLLAVSEFTVAHWPLILGAIVGTALGAHVYLKTKDGRLKWDQYKFNLPIAGSIIHRATMARFARAFAMTMRAGVPVLDGLRLSARGVDNRFVEQQVGGMREKVERGESLSRTATGTGLFTPLVLQMLSVGEESGRVDEMMQEVAEFYEREVSYEIKGLSGAIEPILIIFVGIVVTIMALGVFLPLWELNAAMQHR